MGPAEESLVENSGLDQLKGHTVNADMERQQEQAPPLPGADPNAPPEPDYQKAGAMFTEMVVNMICAFEPKCEQYWPEKTRAAVAKAAGDVCEKYEVTGEFMGPEIVLLMLAGPPLYQCSKLIAEGMNNPPPKATPADAHDMNAGRMMTVENPALKENPYAIPGMESGNSTHSKAMMELQT